MTAAVLPSEYDKRQAASRMAGARLAQAARQLALARDQTLSLDVHLSRANDQSVVVASDVGDFQNSFLEALAIVLRVSFLSLGWRTSIVVFWTTPSLPSRP